MGKRILIVDDDPWVCRMVGTMLERRGHTVSTADNGKEGLARAHSFKPQLIISDVMMSEMDGWTLVRSLRARPELAMVPVIFLTALNSDEDRILGFRLGADDYLAKPFRFEELDLRVAKALRNVDRMQAQLKTDLAETESVGLRGELAHLGVSTLLTLLEMERKSGILAFQGDHDGRVFMREGRVVSAIAEGDAEMQGAEAIYEMLTWTTGTFEFSSLDVDMDDQIKTSTTHLLMEGARRIDDARAAAEHE